MRLPLVALPVVFFLACSPVHAQTIDGPTNEKAQKSYKEALQLLRERKEEWALDAFKKADKQDNGHCLACQKQMIKYGTMYGDWKTAELAAVELLDEAKENKEAAMAHYQYAQMLMAEASNRHKEELFSRAHDEATKAVAAYSNFPEAILLDGKALANLKQDDAAKAQFERFLKVRSPDNPDYRRVQRFIEQPELARARMAPPFAVTTVVGDHISMDDLQGKVVLLDFWATWCVPCREALPHIKQVAKKFQREPLVILSISLDSSEDKWKEFITKNEMAWLQYRDGGFTGPIAKMFSVRAIPATFTIDSDGVLQDEHIGDASIEGKLKKLIARAREFQQAEGQPK
ncbi:MAG TPA: TlpA disulfide reductase family protein [Candidatus Acidoferrum sp.]|nr:TlpA disulfide reductase family protein [Candidatus Acidoferrum sp.]